MCPGVLVLLTFPLRIRGAWGSRDNPCVFFSGQLKGERGYFQVCLQEWDGRACPGELPLEFLGSGKPASIPKAGSYPSLLSQCCCVPLREDVYVCERERVCKSVCVKVCVGAEGFHFSWGSLDP